MPDAANGSPPLDAGLTSGEAAGRLERFGPNQPAGDNDLVARHVCSAVGLDGGRVVTGDDIDGMTDSALGHVAEEASVFARLSPAQKNRVLRALKARGHAVGFLGDGVDDAPSLRAADVGE